MTEEELNKEYWNGYYEGEEQGKLEERERIREFVLKKARTFRVINGKANKCCKESFIYAEEVYNDKLNEIAEQLQKEISEDEK